MDSINPEINAMHAAFCEAVGYDVALLPPAERHWYEALKMGMTPDDVRLVVRHRKQRIKAGVRHEESLKIRNIAGSEDAISESLEEVAAVKAKMRVNVVPKGKAEVLRATGRSDQPEQPPAKPIGEYIEALRKAVG